MTVEALFLIAICLLIAEAFIPSFGLLGFGGFIAFVSGVWTLIASNQPDFYGLSIQSIIAIGILTFLTFALFGFFLMKSLKKSVQTGMEYMINQPATIKSWHGHEGIITFEGEDWRAVSEGSFNPNDTVIITHHKKMTLTVKKEN